MTTNTKNRNASQQIPLPVWIGAVVALVLFACWIAYRSFGPAPAPPEPPKSANRLRMEQIYKSSGGDLSKLNAADRAWVHDYSGGREQEAFSFYKTQASQQ